MSANSSSPNFDFVEDCTEQNVGKTMSTTFILTKVSVSLPLCLFVLLLGCRRWRQRSLVAASHSDAFAYHAAALGLLFVVGVLLLFGGRFTGFFPVTQAGLYVTSAVFIGEISFHVLTCSERYVAVVHPVTYLGLKQAGGVKIRNIGIGCVWLLTFSWIGVTHIYYPDVAYGPYFCLLGFSLAVVCFCSLSVLCVLIRPGPGKVGGNKQRADQSKLRAFHTVTAIMAVLLLFFLGVLTTFVLSKSLLLSFFERCVLLLSGNWCSLPSSLVLPLLFLHRARKLPCCRGNNS